MVKGQGSYNEQLEKKTELFWQQYSNGQDDKTYLEAYIEELLPSELEHIRSSYGGQRSEQGLVENLVLMVGHTVEPLLIAMCYWQPKTVAFVVNKEYGSDKGKYRFQMLIKLVEKFTKSSITDRK